MLGVYRSNSYENLVKSATSIQAAFRGHLSRVRVISLEFLANNPGYQRISLLQKECIQLRQALNEKENALFEAMLLINSKDTQIACLKKVV